MSACCHLENITVTIYPFVLQELLLRLVEDYYPLPSNPSQEPPTAPTATPSHLRTPASKRKDSAALPNCKSGTSPEQANKKRKRGKGVKEAGPKSRRTKKSVKASKGVQEDVLKAEVRAESFDGESSACHMHVFATHSEEMIGLCMLRPGMRVCVLHQPHHPASCMLST